MDKIRLYVRSSFLKRIVTSLHEKLIYCYLPRRWREVFFQFWNENPAFLFSSFLFLGATFTLVSVWALLPLLLLLLAIPVDKVFLCVFLFFAECFFVSQVFKEPPDQLTDTFCLHIRSLSKVKHGWMYRGSIDRFPHATCSVFSKIKYPATCDYFLHGTIAKKRPFNVSINTKEKWQAISQTHSFAELRYQIKNKFKHYLERYIPDKQAAKFLTAFAIGVLEDETLFQTFKRLGLSHLLVISGLHFASVAGCAYYLLSPFCSPKKRAFLTILLLTGYFFILGPSPSIQRAWIVSVLVFLSILIDRVTYPINTLGVALGILMIWDPTQAVSMSFHLSFLATAGILFFYKPLTFYLFPAMRLSDVLKRSLLWQQGYLVFLTFERAFAITCAVHIPLTLYLLKSFHVFPIHGLLYNIFVPLLVVPCPFLLMIGVIFHAVIPPLGMGIHLVNAFYTHVVIKLVESNFIPIKTFYVQSIPDSAIAASLTALFAIAVFLLHNVRTKTVNAFQSSPQCHASRLDSIPRRDV